MRISSKNFFNTLHNHHNKSQLDFSESVSVSVLKAFFFRKSGQLDVAP